MLPGALPLDGLRILAATQLGAGPFGMMFLADLGAEVVKIEDPATRGDEARRVPPFAAADANDVPPKAKGTSYLICDMQAPGVTVRPLRQLTGSEEFNEVFLEDVVIPREHLVGREHEGWAIANTTLAHERGTSPRQLVIHRMLLHDLLRLAREGRDGAPPAAADPVLRQRIAHHFLEVEITRLNNWRTLTRLQKRLPLGPESSFIKLFWSEMSQRMHDTLMELLGPRGLCWQPGPHAVAGGRLARSYLYYRAASLFAGTSEIQRHILAERVLGLPRSR